MKLTIYELAQSLALPSGTVERWIRQGRIPIQKSGDSCIFKETVLKKWADAHNLLFSLKSSESSKFSVDSDNDLHLENLLPAMQRGGVFYNIKGDKPETVLQAALEDISFLSASRKSLLYEKLLERENLTSTGIGKGIAIPHPRTPMEMEQPVILTCFLEKPINFNSIDDKPVFVMFIMLSHSVKVHLHLLSRLSFCVRDDTFIRFLKTIPDSSEFFSRIAKVEKRLVD